MHVGEGAPLLVRNVPNLLAPPVNSSLPCSPSLSDSSSFNSLSERTPPGCFG